MRITSTPNSLAMSSAPEMDIIWLVSWLVELGSCRKLLEKTESCRNSTVAIQKSGQQISHPCELCILNFHVDSYCMLNSIHSSGTLGLGVDRCHRMGCPTLFEVSRICKRPEHQQCSQSCIWPLSPEAMPTTRTSLARISSFTVYSFFTFLHWHRETHQHFLIGWGLLVLEDWRQGRLQRIAKKKILAGIKQHKTAKQFSYGSYGQRL